ncbi:MAG: DUF3109 family protein [Bacteroidales bacterium]|nr:DUF3109 family protein [Bacteroidales bacterium]
MHRDLFGTIIQIGDILVSEEVVTEYFACDYQKCKGACCIEGESGAPLKEEEIPALERDYRSFEELMTEQGRAAIIRDGYFAVDRDGDIVTPLADGGACAFCHFPGDGNCLCAIECKGLRKPVSCSLYPIRVTKLTGGGQALNLHRWHICKDAFRLGREKKIRVYKFLKKPLVAAYGEEFYEALCAAAEHINGSNE